MAGKKPAKRNVSNPKEIKKDPIGKAIMYYGVPGKEFVCPSCSKSLIKGIIYEDSNSMYCSRICIPVKQEA